MPAEELYQRREQTLVKHRILSDYLERFAHIVGSRWSSITYVDGFAGPWNVRSPDFQDSSFAIALDELRKARATYEGQRHINLRCLFIEQDLAAYKKLCDYARCIEDAEIRVLNGSFEDSVPAILSFIRSDRSTFPFVFIDPTGWTGFAMNRISSILRLSPGEVLINFMTGHIRRFLKEENSYQSFAELFGSNEYREQIDELSGQDLDDALVSAYTEALKHEGSFQYVLPAIVLHPEKDRTHFHLIYATRHPKGVEVFKEIEKRAMAKMEDLRASAQRRLSEERTGQPTLFALQTPPPSRHYEELRGRYLDQAKNRVAARLRSGRVRYDDVWILALNSPLVWESDLKEWISEWRSEGKLDIHGLRPRARVPRLNSSHELVWLGES